MNKRGIFFRKSRRSQITIFVIIALIIVVAVGGFFLIRTSFLNPIPPSIAPVYEYYLSCVRTSISDGADIMGSQGGYIEPPEFEPGSTYAPFSNQLAFMGRGIPYWYYLSGNGIEREQIPSKKQMESQFNKYLMEGVGKICDFSSFTSRGYNITLDDSSGVSSTINSEKISVSLSQKLTVQYLDTSVTLTNHNIEQNSPLGRYYDLAKKIYDYQKNNMFLENYTMDVLYNYAPVSGVEFNCSPLIWNPYDVISRLKNALSANIGAIKMKGNYYTPTKYTNYFVVGKSGDIDLKNEQINFVYSPAWPGRFEIWPTENNLMIAKPIGTQQGLAVMGFCYTPYKFVYDMYFPVLIQILSPEGEDIFQFPVAMVINKNNPKEPIPSEYTVQSENICQNANTEISINTYNINLEPIESEVEFRCLTDSCYLGKTKIQNESNELSSLTAKVPQCLNGVLIAKSQGYADKKYTISTNTETSADIVLDKQYKLGLQIYIDGKLTDDLSILSIGENLENTSNTVDSVYYPNSKEINLAEGNYNFNLMVYKSGSINIPSTTSRQCVTVPRAGVLGLFGMEEDKCTDITIPSQTISNLLYAGGNTNYYAIPSELENAKVMKVYASSVKLPSSFAEIPEIYDALEGKSIEIVFE
jgi:hypothetical protein